MANGDSTPKTKNLHMIYGGILLVIGVLAVILLIVIYSQTDTVSTTTNVQNATPSVSSVEINETGTRSGHDTSIPLVESNVKTIYVEGDFADDNGCVDVATSGTITAVLFDNNVASVDSFNECINAEDKNQCYEVTNCTMTGCSGGTDTTGTFKCTFSEVEYFANNSDWKAEVQASDAAGASSTVVASATTTIPGLLALDTVGDVIDYGNLLAGGPVSSEMLLVVDNTGNKDLDYTLQGTDLDCNQGPSIPVGQQEYASSTFTYNNGVDLSTTAAEMNQTIVQRTSETTSSTANSYWQLQVPAGYESTTCSGTNTLVAINP